MQIKVAMSDPEENVEALSEITVDVQKMHGVKKICTDSLALIPW